MSDEHVETLPVEVVTPTETAIAVKTAGALDLDPAMFREGIARRMTNREYLFKQIGSMLKEREDYNVIKGKKCLSKAGSEKILGFLGLTATFPQLNRYEELAFSGVLPENIILKCQIISGGGFIVAEGIGARNLSKDQNDLNKALKMACKSAQIDATLRCVALSDIFTQDLDDQPHEDEARAKKPPTQGAGLKTAYTLDQVRAMTPGDQMAVLLSKTKKILIETANKELARVFSNRKIGDAFLLDLVDKQIITSPIADENEPEQIARMICETWIIAKKQEPGRATE